jgi:hypothetical protein
VVLVVEVPLTELTLANLVVAVATLVVAVQRAQQHSNQVVVVVST